MRQTYRLTSMLLRAYVRDRIALFFSLIVPLMLMVIFGYLNLGDFGRVSIAVDDQAKNAASQQLTGVLRGIGTLQVAELSTDEALGKLRRTELDMLIVIPGDFTIAPARPGQAVPQLIVYGDDARPQQVAVGRSIITAVIDRLSFAVTQTAPVVGVKDESVQGVRLRYVDFLVPGILGVNIMQLAVFSVAFALVADKQRGVLRRIMATPVRITNLLTAHVLTRRVAAAASNARRSGTCRRSSSGSSSGSAWDSCWRSACSGSSASRAGSPARPRPPDGRRRGSDPSRPSRHRSRPRARSRSAPGGRRPSAARTERSRCTPLSAHARRGRRGCRRSR